MDKIKIDLKPRQKLWFTGCIHLHHKNIAGPTLSNWDGGYRNFESVEDMDETLINGINQYVAPDDILFDLGDQVFGSYKFIPDFRKSILCNNFHVLQGNHTSRLKDYASLFSSYHERVELEVTFNYGEEGTRGFTNRKVNMVLGHYPELSWLGLGKGYWMLHSHCHNAPMIREMNTGCKRFETSMDHAHWLYGEYKPFELRELVKIQDDKPIFNVDHHDSQTNVK